MATSAGELAGRALAALAGAGKPQIALAGAGKPQIRWRITRGPWFDNMLAALEFDGRTARIRFDRTVPGASGSPHLQPVCETGLS